MALCPLKSRSRSSASCRRRKELALATNAADPGIVEKCFRRVSSARRSTAIRLHVRLDDFADLHPALAFDDRVFDRRALHRDHFADQLHDVRERSAALATVRAHERIELRVARVFVDEHRDAPAALQHVAGDERRERDRPAGDIDAIDHALLIVVRERAAARAVVGVFTDPARHRILHSHTSRMLPIS